MTELSAWVQFLVTYHYYWYYQINKINFRLFRVAANAGLIAYTLTLLITYDGQSWLKNRTMKRNTETNSGRKNDKKCQEILTKKHLAFSDYFQRFLRRRDYLWCVWETAKTRSQWMSSSTRKAILKQFLLDFDVHYFYVWGSYWWRRPFIRRCHFCCCNLRLYQPLELQTSCMVLWS